jgi:hypothetical protein
MKQGENKFILVAARANVVEGDSASARNKITMIAAALRRKGGREGGREMDGVVKQTSPVHRQCSSFRCCVEL